MPMLKTVSAGKGSVVGLQSYLTKDGHQEAGRYQQEIDLYEQGSLLLPDYLMESVRRAAGAGSRALYVDVSEDLTPRNWGRQMDLTRLCYNHDVKTAQGESRSYYHFILSPSPRDDCSLDTLRQYAQAWTQANFRSKGKLHEYAIVAHDDNTTGVLHAHIVVNATNKMRGRKLHLDNEEVVGLQLSAQTIGKKYGLTPLREEMQATLGARTNQPIYLDRQEREMLNRGELTWKWEVRQIVSLMAPLSANLKDFKQKMNRAGFDVEVSYRSGALLYTHRNGLKVRDSRLGSRFYLSSLEQAFGHEHLAEDPDYQSWQQRRITKGSLSWQEDIRQAIDAIAPTVVSMPEMQEGLEQEHGIRLMVNRQGIQYRHPSGLRVRDASLGFRYTLAGMRYNAAIGEALPYPGFQDILRESAAMVKHYLPRSPQGMPPQAPEWTASHFIFQDLAHLLVAKDLVNPDELAPLLENEHRDLVEEKQNLASLRQELMRLNRLSSLQERCEQDAEWIQQPENLSSSDAEGVRLRLEQASHYLAQQAVGPDIRQTRQRLMESYQQQLESYQDHVGAWSQDAQIYQNYLMGRTVQERKDWISEEGIDAAALFEAGQTLSSYRIRDYFHLEQELSTLETRSDLTDFRLKNASQQKKELEQLSDEIRAYTELGAIVEENQQKDSDSLTLEEEAQIYVYHEACRHLNELGVSKRDFAGIHRRYKECLTSCKSLEKELETLSQAQEALLRAYKVCQAMANAVKAAGGNEQVHFSDSRQMPDVHEEDTKSNATEEKTSKEPMALPDDLPFEEARERRQKRLSQLPNRAKQRQKREREEG